MRSIIHKLRPWCEGCPDGERLQLVMRLAIAASALIITLGLASAPYYFGATASSLALILAAQTCVLIAILVHAATVPGASPVRRWIRSVSDFATIAALMSLGAEFAPLYVICLWLAIDNGLRFGSRSLPASVGLAATSFAGVIACTLYWRHNMPLSIGLLAGLFVIPSYVVSLQKASIRATRKDRAKSRVAACRTAGMETAIASVPEPIVRMSEWNADPWLDEQGRYPEVPIRLATRPPASGTADFELSSLLSNIRSMLEMVAVAKGIRFETHVEQDVPSSLRGDGVRLQQILFLLVSNAFESTERGRVTIDVSLRGACRDDGIPLRFSVLDTGFGIPDPAREKVLDASVPAGFGAQQGIQGFDKGCTIRSLAETVGGVVSSESVAGNGSHFWLDLDLVDGIDCNPSHRAALAIGGNIIEFSDPFVRHRARVRPLELLIADDQRANVSLLRRILEKAGHRVRSAATAEQLLAAMDGCRFDAVLVDVTISETGALDLIKRSKMLRAGAAGVPFVVFCADADAVPSAEQVGAYAILERPVVVPNLLAAIAGIAMGSALSPISRREPGRAGLAGELISARVIEELRELRLGEAFLDVFISECVRDSAKCIVELEKLAMVSRWDQYRDQCHALKGVAGNMGAIRLAGVASRGMHMASWELATHGRSLIAELSTELERAGVALKRVMTPHVVEAGPDMA